MRHTPQQSFFVAVERPTDTFQPSGASKALTSHHEANTLPRLYRIGYCVGANYIVQQTAMLGKMLYSYATELYHSSIIAVAPFHFGQKIGATKIQASSSV